MAAKSQHSPTRLIFTTWLLAATCLQFCMAVETLSPYERMFGPRLNGARIVSGGGGGTVRAFAAPVGPNAVGDPPGKVNVTGQRMFVKVGGYRDGFTNGIFEETEVDAAPDITADAGKGGDEIFAYEDNRVLDPGREAPLTIPAPYRADGTLKENTGKEAKPKTPIPPSTTTAASTSLAVTQAPESMPQTSRPLVASGVDKLMPISVRTTTHSSATPSGVSQAAKLPPVRGRVRPGHGRVQRPPQPAELPSQPAVLRPQPQLPPLPELVPQPPPLQSLPQPPLPPQPVRQPPPLRLLTTTPLPPQPAPPFQTPPPQPPQPPFTQPPPAAPPAAPTLAPPSPQRPLRPLRPFRPRVNPPNQPPRGRNPLRTGVCPNTIFYQSVPATLAELQQPFSHFAVVVSIDQCARTCHEFNCANAFFDPRTKQCQFNPSTKSSLPAGACPEWPNPLYRNNIVISEQALRISCVTCQRRRRPVGSLLNPPPTANRQSRFSAFLNNNGDGRSVRTFHTTGFSPRVVMGRAIVNVAHGVLLKQPRAIAIQSTDLLPLRSAENERTENAESGLTNAHHDRTSETSDDDEKASTTAAPSTPRPAFKIRITPVRPRKEPTDDGAAIDDAHKPLPLTVEN